MPQPAAKVSQAGAHLDSVRRALAAAQAAVPPVQQALAEEQAKVAKYSGEKFSMAKVFTTHHHMETKLGQ